MVITLRVSGDRFKDLAIVCMDMLFIFNNSFNKKELLKMMRAQLQNNGYNVTAYDFNYPEQKDFYEDKYNEFFNL